MASNTQPKRHRLLERDGNTQSQIPASQRNRTSRHYDPDQDPEERRRVRKGYRSLGQEFNGMEDQSFTDSTNLLGASL